MSRFQLSRSTRVEAHPERVRGLIDDYRAWQSWSPWEGVDPELQRRYSGPDRGVGAVYEWSGNKKAGEGRMEILESTPDRVVSDLEFLKPFKARNETRFDLAPAGSRTEVTWTMTGEQNPAMRLLGRLFFDKAIARDFERGLAALKAEAESGAPGRTGGAE